MRNVIMNMLMSYIFASCVLRVFGKVTVLRGSSNSNTRKLICLSEDDGGALVWNSNLVWQYETYTFLDRSGDMRFHSRNQFNAREVDCKMNTLEDSCLNLWSKQSWWETDSFETPMGPVFDQRWEEFKEYVNAQDQFERIELRNTTGAALSFSVRVLRDAHILLCDGKNYNHDHCYWVIIGGWGGAKSVIRKCSTGVPVPGQWPSGTECEKELVSLNHTSISATEWRSFVITWNSTTRNITLYDTEKLIMTYEDVKPSENATVNFHLFIRSPVIMLFRFHLYNFLHTISENAILKSPTFLLSNPAICIQMFIGLCVECEAHLILRNFTSQEVLNRVIAKGSSTAHGLPMWQSVTIRSNISTIGYSYVSVELIPTLRSYSSKPLWAISDVRQCSNQGSLRQGIMWAYQDYTSDYYWPNVTCQKIFYNEHTTVNSASNIKMNIKLEDENCLEGVIGPQCSFYCKADLNNVENCKGTALCYKDGCTCPSGLYGAQCGKYCERNTYGHGCRNLCGICSSGTCNRVTGECLQGCNNKKKVHIPPFCQIGIEKPDIPIVDFINETSIQVSFPMKGEYKETLMFYAFEMNEKDGGHIRQGYTPILPNMTSLVGYFENLQPGTTYDIIGILHVAHTAISSERKIIQTKCNHVESFQTKAEEDSLMIDWQFNKNLLYLCPANWYRVVVHKVNTNEQIMNQVVTYFPHKVPHLLSYTFFNMTIFHDDQTLFSREIRTLESVPSKILDIRATLSFNNEVTLVWTPPDKPNGKILRYEVVLKIETYCGCENLHISPSNNPTIIKSTTDTMITIPDLHPYAKYNIEIMAYNSRHSSIPANISFQTKMSEIPAAIFSHVRVRGWKLLWNPPEDCTTILGPLYARIKIRGISDTLNESEVEKNTGRYILDLDKIPNLYGAEQYVAKVYVTRNYASPENTSAYRECLFETPPKAPPKLTKFEVVEIDTREKTWFTHLRWQNPLPPLNGKLSHYSIISYNRNNPNCGEVRVELNSTCDLWDQYLCKTIPRICSKISVYAYNVNVSESSPAATVHNEIFDNTIPDAPTYCNFTINTNGIVDLTWPHPSKTYNHLRCFNILIKKESSNLEGQITESDAYPKIYSVTNYARNYSDRLYLLPSTEYTIGIQAVTITNKSSVPQFVKIRTLSAIYFDGNLTAKLQNSDSMISLRIPKILNNTRNSMMHIIVKGPNPCEEFLAPPKNLQKLAGIKMYDIAWQAANISASIYAGKLFTIGDNEIYGGVINCPLKSKELYEIIVIVSERDTFNKPITLVKSTMIRIGEVPLKYHEAWIVPLILCLIVAGALCYLYRRKKQKSIKQQMLPDEIILSQNTDNYEHDTKSVISNSKQGISTPSDRESLSRATTPEILLVALTNDDKEKDMMSLVKVKDFEDYVRKAIQSGLLEKQYSTFPRGQTRPWDYGKLPQNKSKNRYGNLIAYDETRVILEKFPDDAYSDYINANYITGYKREKRYIATQGPKPNTVVDFWRMIWQEKVSIICMLANVVENGKIKCEQYWPDIGKKKKYGEIVVLNAKHNVFADYCFRTLHVTYGEETRKIEHLHYTAWPDHGVPLYTHSVVTYLKKLLATPPGNGPVVIHCSAGVGRTGTIILCDICLHRAAAEGVVDVFADTESIRNERANMVDNKPQYLLAHLALVECLLSIPTTLPCNEMLPTRITELKKQLTIQQQRLQDTAWQDEALRQVTSLSLSERNRAKNRFPELISDTVSRIYLKRYPASDEDSDYLSAVYVDGVKLQNQYLATQLPMPSTINDFWRMIAEFKVELILMLQSPDPEDSTCCTIAPVNGEFKPVPYLNIIAKEIVEMEYCTSQKLQLIDNSEEPKREQPVTILCSTEWKPGRNQSPPPVITMVTLWQAAERIARGDGPTVTLCHDGVTVCGLYLALNFLLERMAVERECDVCLAVRAVRRSRPDFVQSSEHLEYLYDAALTYLEYFETYANFM